MGTATHGTTYNTAVTEMVFSRSFCFVGFTCAFLLHIWPFHLYTPREYIRKPSRKTCAQRNYVQV